MSIFLPSLTNNTNYDCSYILSIHCLQNKIVFIDDNTRESDTLSNWSHRLTAYMTLMILCSIYRTLENIRISSLKVETVAIFCQEVFPSLFIPTHTHDRSIDHMRIAERIENVSLKMFHEITITPQPPVSPSLTHAVTYSRLFCTCLLLFFDVFILVILCYIFKRWLIIWFIISSTCLSIVFIQTSILESTNQPTNYPQQFIHLS